MDKLKITPIVDDLNGALEGYRLSYGFALLIEINNKKILFDTGTNIPPLIFNLEKYGVKPNSIDFIILSHNHFDHTDGLPGILEINKNVPVYVHKHWQIRSRYRGRSIPSKNLVINQNARECTEMTKGLFLTNSHLSPDYGGIHEHACFVQSKDSVILICGCCHPGLNKFLEDRIVLNIPLDHPLHIIGGMHSFQFTTQRALEVNRILRSIKLFHCTQNIKIFKNQFKQKCQIGIVGRTIEF
jgi:7,8-dihydropterin-6-yl-methyl-4-(beta-D-ribofuranosyl)aminobenzene 5'-phosphate synthase